MSDAAGEKPSTNEPSVDSLLDAMARFLEAEVAPIVAAAKDPRTNFRLLIARHLLWSLADELRSGAPRGAGAFDDAERARAIRDGSLADSPSLREQLRAALAARLTIVSPRFDLRMRIE
jgi:hypothetical protein